MIRPVNASPTLRVSEITEAQQVASASGLYRDVFGYTKPEATLNPRLLMAMAANGGSMVGAWNEAEELVAFGYGFTGYAGGETYFYSQAVVVADGLQGAGVGRLIKAEQRRLALAAGLHRMRWAFNPILARNAHFNLSVLGAVGRWFVPDCYGDGESRLLVEWDLDSRHPTTAMQPWDDHGPTDWGLVSTKGELSALAIPADREQVDDQLTERIDDAFISLTSAGLAALSCTRVSPDTAVYVFGRELR